MEYYWLVCSFMYGAVIGSFLNVVIMRLPMEESLVRPPSRCPHCGHGIRYHDNIPIIGYFMLLGRCRDCGAPISFRYPLIEAVTGALAAGLYWQWGFSPAFVLLFAFCAAMVVVFWIDLDHMIIPDVISLNGVAVGVLAALAGIIPDMLWTASLVGAVLGAIILYAPAVLYEWLRGVEGLGRGDIKLLAMIGAFTGPAGVIFVLFFSSVTGCVAALIGIVFRGAQSSAPIPFGPFLTSSAVLYVFGGRHIIDLFLRFSHWFWSANALVANPVFAVWS